MLKIEFVIYCVFIGGLLLPVVYGADVFIITWGLWSGCSAVDGRVRDDSTAGDRSELLAADLTR